MVGIGRLVNWHLQAPRTSFSSTCAGCLVHPSIFEIRQRVCTKGSGTISSTTRLSWPITSRCGARYPSGCKSTRTNTASMRASQQRIMIYRWLSGVYKGSTGLSPLRKGSRLTKGGLPARRSTSVTGTSTATQESGPAAESSRRSGDRSTLHSQTNRSQTDRSRVRFYIKCHPSRPRLQGDSLCGSNRCRRPHRA